MNTRKAYFSSSYSELFLTDRYTGLKNVEWDHALLDVYVQYGADLSSYYRLFEHLEGDRKGALRFFLAQKGDPREGLHTFLAESLANNEKNV